jgi:ABC-2 type transport system ATP-binding protein
MLKADGIVKHFGKLEILKGTDFEVGQGEVTLLLGRNGAGKTTLFNLMLGALPADGGRMTVLGLDSRRDYLAIRERTGYLPENDTLYMDWTVADNIAFVRKFYANWDLETEGKMAEKFKLSLKQKVSTLNRGARRKISLLLAFSHHAELLLLDEPLSGLDPIFREEILLSLIEAIQEKGGTFLISSHFVEDLENLATSAVFLNDGRVAARGSADTLRATFGEITLNNGDPVPEGVQILNEAAMGGKRTLAVQWTGAGPAPFATSLTLTEIFKRVC